MKELLVLQGFLAPPGHIDKLQDYIEDHTSYRTHSLLKSSGNINIWRGQKQKVLDKVHELTDRSQSKIAIVGHSLGGLHGAEVAFENPAEVDEVITVFSPVLFLRGKPRDVQATTIYSSRDKYVRHPLGINYTFNKRIDYPVEDHSAPLYTPRIQEIVIANLKMGAKVIV